LNGVGEGKKQSALQGKGEVGSLLLSRGEMGEQELEPMTGNLAAIELRSKEGL